MRLFQFFFLKQKTAIEMSISDWSSDVCSSDLVLGNGDIWEASDALDMIEQTGCDGVVVGRGCLGRPWLFRDLADAFAGRPVPDRKSVVSGKSVSVRIDLGGRRLIKINKPTNS